MSNSHHYTEREIRTIALAVITGVFFGGVATGVAFPTLPLLDDHLAISAVTLSVILSANRIARLVMNTPAGAIVDRLGARWPMICGLFTQAAAPFGYIIGLGAPTTMLALPGGATISIPGVVFVLARLFWGIGSAFVFIGAFATISHVTTSQNRGRWISYMRGGQSLGFPTGLVVGGVVADLFDIQTAFLVAGVLALAAGVTAAMVLPDVHRGGADESVTLRSLPGLLARQPIVLAVGVGNFSVRFLWGGIILSTMARFASDHAIRLGSFEAAGISGLVMAVGVLCSGSATLATGKLSDRIGNRSILTVPAFCSMAAGFVVLAVGRSVEPLLGAIVCIGLGMGVVAPSLLAILGDLTPGDELGRMGGIYNGMGDVGLSLGPLVAVPAVDLWFGYRNTYLLCAMLLCGCLLVVSVPLFCRTTASGSNATVSTDGDD
ncbi:MFS transporter [Halocatena halophila]|uniref:MFS transporter n=1 Tax=Halocatena halophila TaxID=2814576 RepID=UPI002ED1F68E